MTNITLEQAEALQKEAKENDGKCSHCGHAINIYDYPVNKVMVAFLKKMAEMTDELQSREIDVEKVSTVNHERTQITKLRVHGLIAKVKDADGHHRARMWIITKKGWGFLRGEEIPRKVVIYNNQVLGHVGGMTSVKRIDGASDEFEKTAISEPEAKQLADVRTPQKMTEFKAEYRGNSGSELLKGRVYDVQVERLQIGKPVIAHVYIDRLKGGGWLELKYGDVASYTKNWKKV